MHTQPRAIISRSNLAHNYETLRKLAAPGQVGAVVKANAYGHGVECVAQTLSELGCKTFFTATTDEAVDVRQTVGDAAGIMVFNGVPDEKADLAKAHKITPIINTLHQLRGWRMHGMSEIGPAVLHFDTGMNRLGLRP